MAAVFLTAQWRNLLMANYAIDPAVLKPYLPCHTELDAFEGVHYVSLVGFLFTNVRLRGIAIPFHTIFEEVNLRFYVRYKEGSNWKRGVVFIKEIVPKRAITFIANTLYKENYRTHRMKHRWTTEGNALQVEYQWQVGREWNYIKAVAETNAVPIQKGSAEEFITEHYWGYTFVNDRCTGVYQVAHPQWGIHPVKEYTVYCNAEKVYGAAFADALQETPRTVFLADGSNIQVFNGAQIRTAG